MSVSAQMKAAGVTAPTGAPVSAPTAPTAPQTSAPQTPAGSKNMSKAKLAHQKFVANGDAIAASVSDEVKVIEGSKSDKVVFIQCLGDATKTAKRTQGGDPNVPTHLVIGYAFKALEDMTVPCAPYKSSPKDIMDVEPATERPVKAGEEFYLNVVESALLISRPEYCGRFTGEGTTVSLSVKFKNDSEEPRPALVKAGDGSIKENMDLVNNVSKDAEGRLKHEGCKPQYTAFEPWFVRKTASRVQGGSKQSKDSAKSLAYAFAAYMQNKKG